MYDRIKIFFLIVFLLTISQVSFCAQSQYSNEKTQPILDSLARAFSETDDVKEKIFVLQNVADLMSSTTSRCARHWDVIALARKIGDSASLAESACELINAPYDSLKKYFVLIEELYNKDSLTKPVYNYLKGALMKKKIARMPDSLRMVELEHYISDFRVAGSEQDIFDEILTLNNICSFLGASIINGNLFLEYMEKQKKLVEQLPMSEYSYYYGLIYSDMASYCHMNGEYHKAYECDTVLLSYIKDREAFYKSSGRKYRQYYNAFYFVYRRMLGAFSVLPKDTIHFYIEKLKDLAKESELIQYRIKSDAVILINYYMATEQYDKAMIYIDNVLKKKRSEVPFQLYVIYKHKVQAARALNNKNVLLEAYYQYFLAFEDFNKYKALERQKELEILYQVGEINNMNKELILKNKEAEITNNRWILFFAIMIMLLLFALLLASTFYNVKMKRMTSQLIQAKIMAEQSSKIKTAFVQNMSHEIRTPLNAVVGFSNVLAETYAEKDPEVKEYTRIIQNNNDMLVKLIDDLLQLSDIELGKVSCDLRDVCINELCSLSLASVKSRAKEGVALQFYPEAGTDFSIQTDPTRLQQILTNFLINATKFTDSGYIKLSYAISRSENKIKFMVEDTGCGIAEDKAELIFNRFEKLNEYMQGSGLGLYISRELARQLSGDIILDKTYKNGARFILILPLNSNNLRDFSVSPV